MPLIVLSNRHILHILYTDFTAPTGARLCYFPESNAKALSTGYALSKVPLRPAGGKLSVGQHTVLADGERLFAALLLPHASVCVDSVDIFYTAPLSKIPSQPTHIVALTLSALAVSK